MQDWEHLLQKGILLPLKAVVRILDLVVHKRVPTANTYSPV